MYSYDRREAATPRQVDYALSLLSQVDSSWRVLIFLCPAKV